MQALPLGETCFRCSSRRVAVSGSMAAVLATRYLPPTSFGRSARLSPRRSLVPAAKGRKGAGRAVPNAELSGREGSTAATSHERFYSGPELGSAKTPPLKSSHGTGPHFCRELRA
jgi:hypothetical protein